MTRVLPFVLSLTGLVALWISLPALALFALFLLAATLLPAKTTLAAAALVVPVAVGGLCAWLTVGSLLHVRNPPSLLLAVGLVLCAALSLPRRPRRPLASRLDLTAATSGLIAFAIVYRPFLGSSTGTRLALLSRTTDSATHLEMVRAVAKLGSYLTLVPRLDESTTRGVQHYPPGFSGLAGSLIALLVGPSSSLDSFVGASVVIVSALFGTFIWLLTMLAGHLLTNARPGAAEMLTLGVAVLGLGLVGPAALLLADGAYAQILALVALAASVLIACAPAEGAAGTTVMLALTTVAGMHAWYLIAPAFAVPWLVHAARSRRGPRLVVALALTGAVSAFPLLTGPGRSQLHVVGFIDTPNHGSNAALLLATLAAFGVLVLAPTTREARLPLVGTTVFLLLGAVFLGVGQILVTGSLSYYFFKALVGAGAFATALLAGCAALALHELRQAHGIARRAGALGTTFALILLPLPVLLGDDATRAPAFGIAPQQIAGGLQKTRAQRSARGLRQHAIVALLDRMLEDHPQGVDAQHDVWYLGCSRAQMYVLDKWIYDLSLTWTPARQYLIDSLRFESRDLVADLERRADTPSLRSLEIYHDNTCPPRTLGNLASNPKVRLVDLG